MRVEFANNRLRRCYHSYSIASRAWGDVIARRYINRIETLRLIERFDDLYPIRSLRLHRLSGQRTGQFAIVLDRRWRLIITYSREDNAIRIEEVTNHCGD